MRSALWLLAAASAVTGLPQASSISGNSSNGTSYTNGTNSTTVPLGTRARFGLQPSWMQVNSIYVGFLPDWRRENPIDINKELGKSMAIM